MQMEKQTDSLSPTGACWLLIMGYPYQCFLLGECVPEGMWDGDVVILNSEGMLIQNIFIYFLPGKILYRRKHKNVCIFLAIPNKIAVLSRQYSAKAST